MADELSAEVHAEITELCSRGDEFSQSGDLESARAQYVAALRLIPGDHRRWAASTWIYVAIGDTHFLAGTFDKAFKSFSNAVQCPGGLGNPYIHLRLGQLYFESNDLDKAADELTRAYMGAGLDIFAEDDPKYLEFLETRIQL